MLRKTYIFLFFISIAFVSCDKGPSISQYGKKFEEIMKSPEGMFRGLDLGKSVKEIKAAEGESKPKDEDKNYLYYEFKTDTGELYSIEYNFDERGLNEVRLDVYYINPADARSLFVAFRDYYTKKYGETDKFEGFAAWGFHTPDNKKIQIEMTDESAEYRQGKFSFTLYYVVNDPIKDPPKKQ